jgi:hypothetical protein
VQTIEGILVTHSLDLAVKQSLDKERFVFFPDGGNHCSGFMEEMLHRKRHIIHSRHRVGKALMLHLVGPRRRIERLRLLGLRRRKGILWHYGRP